ncbi:MAG: hypothetical protein AAAFM81_02350 [Pseudomonadota bacterium]
MTRIPLFWKVTTICLSSFQVGCALDRNSEVESWESAVDQPCVVAEFVFETDYETLGEIVGRHVAAEKSDSGAGEIQLNLVECVAKDKRLPIVYASLYVKLDPTSTPLALAGSSYSGSYVLHMSSAELEGFQFHKELDVASIHSSIETSSVFTDGTVSVRGKLNFAQGELVVSARIKCVPVPNDIRQILVGTGDDLAVIVSRIRGNECESSRFEFDAKGLTPISGLPLSPVRVKWQSDARIRHTVWADAKF